MKTTIINGFKWLSILYITLCTISFLFFTISDLPSFNEVGHLKNGCYTSNALLPYVECKGLKLNSLIKFFYNLWYIPIFGLGFITYFPLGSFMGLVTWSPVFYIIWYWLKGRHLKKIRISH